MIILDPDRCKQLAVYCLTFGFSIRWGVMAWASSGAAEMNHGKGKVDPCLEELGVYLGVWLRHTHTEAFMSRWGTRTRTWCCHVHRLMEPRHNCHLILSQGMNYVFFFFFGRWVLETGIESPPHLNTVGAVRFDHDLRHLSRTAVNQPC